MKTIYLHIGMQKTGSTSLQSFLYDNSKLILDKLSLNYLSDSDIIGSPNAHHNLAYYYLGKKKKIRGSYGYEEVLNRFLNGITSAKGDVIISSEEFSYFTQSEIKMFCKDFSEFNIVPIMFCREQTILLESLYKQYMKVNWSKGITNFLKSERKRFEYDKIVDTWLQLCENKVELLVYENIDADMIARGFLEKCCGTQEIDMSNFSNKMPKKNISLSPELTLFQSEVHKHISYNKNIRRNLEKINHYFDNSKGFFFITEDQYIELKKYYHDSNTRLLEMYNEDGLKDYNNFSYSEHPKSKIYRGGMTPSLIAAINALLAIEKG